MLNLTTDHGDLDLAFEPAVPRRGFDDWNSDADDVEIARGLVIRMAGLDAVIDSERARGRPKDQGALGCLESLRNEIQGSKGRSG